MNSKLLPLRQVLILVALVSFVAVSRAQSTNRYAGTNFSFLDSKAMLAAAADVTVAKYPDCDEATVEKKMIRVYRPDGTGESQDEAFVKVLTEKGKRSNRTLSLSFMLPYATVEVVKLEVIRPAGEVLPVDVAANSKETIDDSQMSMNIYDPNMRVLRVNIPSLEIGDIVHSITRENMERSIIPGQFAEESVFEGPGFIRHSSYEVHAPMARPLQRIALRDQVPGTIQYSTHAGPDQTQVHHWEISNVPRMFDEPSMPPYEMVLQRLLVSTMPDWLAVSKWYSQLSQPHLEATTPELKKTVEDLTKSAHTDLEKVQALFYHVSKQVRYMGLTPEKDRPGFEPHDVSITFEKKYGVCRDKAALLVSMLRAAGLKAYPVLINVGTRKDTEVPDADFNHAIVAAELKPREYVLMDPTDENTREILPSTDCNQSYLVCRPEGEGIKISPIEPVAENLMEVQTTGTLTSDGVLEARSEIRCIGVNDDIYRNMLVHLKPDDQHRFFESNLKQVLPGARLKSLTLTPTNMLDVSQPVQAVLEFSASDVAASGGGKSLLSLPWVGNRLGALRFFLGAAGLDKRKYPMRTWVTCGLKEHISLQLDSSFSDALSLPSCSPVEDECVAYHQSYSAKTGSLECSRELDLKVVEFGPDQYLRLKQTLKQLECDERKAPLLANSRQLAASLSGAAPTAEERAVVSNAKILESHKELEILDPHSSVYRVRYSKQILNYAGKIREAELKIDYNPACQDAKLVRAIVISKTGQRQEISKTEINLMDAGWNASAKRYTGDKILVANLPGVDIGSTIEVEFEITSKNKPFLAGFEAFQLPDELERKSFQLTAPCDVKVQHVITGPSAIVNQDDKSDKTGQTIHWRAENVKALPAESQLPPDWVYAAGVQYYVGDPKAYFQSLHEAMLDRSRNSAQATETARKLATDKKNAADKLMAIRDFVAKSIREAGPSFADLPLSELSAADTTLSDGYGHSADRAILLHAMLGAAGFQPEFVLASGLPSIAGITNVTDSFPMPQAFAMPLVKVSVDGTTYYLNDTDQYSKLGSTRHDGKLGIVLVTQASEVIHAAPECGDKTDTAYTLNLDDHGNSRLGITRHYYGSEDNLRNRYFSELPPEERKRYFQQIVSSVSQGAKPLGELVTRFDTYPGVEEFTVAIENYAVVDGKYLYFDLPFTPSLFPNGASRRTLPLFSSQQVEHIVHTEIHLPPAFAHLVMAPHVQTLDAPNGSGRVRITASNSPGKCLLAHELETSPAIVDPADYARMLSIESALGRKSSRLFLLEKD